MAQAKIETSAAASVPLVSPDAALLALEPVIDEAWERLSEASTAMGQAEAAFFTWSKRNPEPPYRRKAWRLRKEAVARETGVSEARAREAAAGKAFSRAADKMVNIPATTLEGCRCKARMTLKFSDSDLAWAAVDDLANLRAAFSS